MTQRRPSDPGTPVGVPADRSGVIEGEIFRLLDTRGEGLTICPSEVARALAPQEDVWRALMPEVRLVAQGLAEQGRLVVTRRGVEVEATSPGGPIRLRRP